MHTKCSENLSGRYHWRPRKKWEDNIRMDFREIDWEILG
jgi:hypothetical protein